MIGQIVETLLLPNLLKVETPEPTPEERLNNAIKAIDDLVSSLKEKGVSKEHIAKTIKIR